MDVTQTVASWKQNTSSSLLPQLCQIYLGHKLAKYDQPALGGPLILDIQRVPCTTVTGSGTVLTSRQATMDIVCSMSPPYRKYVTAQIYDAVLAPQGAGWFDELTFDSSKPSMGKLFTNFLFLTLACRKLMSQEEKMSKSLNRFIVPPPPTPFQPNGIKRIYN